MRYLTRKWPTFSPATLTLTNMTSDFVLSCFVFITRGIVVRLDRSSLQNFYKIFNKKHIIILLDLPQLSQNNSHD